MRDRSQIGLDRIFLLAFKPAAVLLLWATLAVHPAFAQRPFGIDVSDYQGPNINWPAVRSSGLTFAWAKATEGLTVNDDTFVVNESNASAAGVLIGAYHFAHPELHIGTAGALEEAAHFWSVASNYVNGAGTHLMPMLDIEVDLSSASPPYTTTTLSQWVNTWCSNIVSLAASNGVTVNPVVYTYVSYSSTWLDSTVTKWPLWMAQYPDTPNPVSGAPDSTSPWSSWAVWQYNDTNTMFSGAPSDCDVDVFNGTAAGLGALVIGGLSSPYFSSQPVDQRVTDTGGSVTFSATGGGSPPLAYQWTLNGSNISGATNAAITIINAQLTNAGNYSLILTNSYGSVTGSVVSLLVYPIQTTVFEDSFDTNSAANWTVNKSSGDNAIAFNFDYSTLGIPSAPHSTGGTTRGVQLKANLTLGVVAAISISPLNQSFSGDYRLHFDGWINVNGPFPGGGASSTEFLTAGIGTAGNRTEWTGPGSTADGFYFSADGDGGVSGTSTTSGDYCAYLGSALQSPGTGIYLAGTDTTARDNANVYYTIAFPTGQAAPALQQSTYAQQTGALATGTIGLGWHDFIVSRRGSTVDWSIDGFRVATISNAVFSASNIFVGFWDPFASLTDNTNLSFGLMDNVRVEVPAILPVFITQPLAQTVRLGTNVTFSATATGLPSPYFQWQFDGTNISGATNGSYTIANVATTNPGNYSVVITNVAGSLTSTNAALALVAPAPAQFQSIGVQAGGSAQIVFSGDAFWNYTVETSTNLTDWTTFTNLTSTNGIFNFNAGAITNDSQRFYRARVDP
jgi:GH25 family lysozyme M1 (1,4-beta-N-acetylmuramidase)